jgi:hypothetical protein
MVSNVARAYVRLGHAGARPIAVRYDELRQEVIRTIPVGHRLASVANSMMTEGGIDQMSAALVEYQKEKAASSAPDPRIVGHCREIYSLLEGGPDAYNPCVRQIESSQRALLAWRNDFRLVKCGLITADCFQKLVVLKPNDYGPEKYSSVDESRAAREKVYAMRIRALEIRDAINKALSFIKNLPLDQQLMEMERADFIQQQTQDERLDFLEGAYSAALARIGKLERGLKKEKATNV